MSLERYYSNLCKHQLLTHHAPFRRGGVWVSRSYRLRRTYAITLREHQAENCNATQRLQYLLKVTYDAQEQLAVLRLVYKRLYNYDINRQYAQKQEFEKTVYELYRDGMSIKEIAATFRRDYEVIRRIVRKYDKKTRSYRKLDEVELQFIKQFLLLRAKLSEIAEALNRPVSTIFYAVKRLAR